MKTTLLVLIAFVVSFFFFRWYTLTHFPPSKTNTIPTASASATLTPHTLISPSAITPTIPNQLR